MGTWSYLRSQLSKQTNLVDLQLLSNYALFSKNWGRKLLKKNLEYESILYNSTEESAKLRGWPGFLGGLGSVGA